MGRAYSQDLGDRVIDAVEKDGMSCRAAAGRFWCQREFGDQMAATLSQDRPSHAGGHGRAPSLGLAPHLGLIEAVRLQQPDITLQALCNRLRLLVGRWMAGLAILKHTFDLSDEALCARWVENPFGGKSRVHPRFLSRLTPVSLRRDVLPARAAIRLLLDDALAPAHG